MKTTIHHNRSKRPALTRGEGASGFRPEWPDHFHHPFRIPNSEFRISSPGGSTLTEVLVALMIMSIGLVSVATLFPMSILRSVKATQLTQATDARYNAEAAIDIHQNIIKAPVNVVWNGNNSATPGVWDPPGAGSYSATTNYVFDPLGFAAIQAMGLTTGSAAAAIDYQNHPEHYFGNDPSNGGGLPWGSNPPGAPWLNIARYPLTWRSMANADYLVTLPDSWALQYETVGGTLGSASGTSGFTQITIAGTVFPASAGAPNPTARVVMFSADGTASQTRVLTQVTQVTTAPTSTTLVWTEDFNGNGSFDAGETDVNGNGNPDAYPLPTSFTSLGSIGIVRIEVQERRYTWLLTIRQTVPPSVPPSGNIDVVVFFKRSFEFIDVNELLYDARFTLSSTQVTVTYPTTTNPKTGLPLKPYMKKGSYVFEANNAYWYRIANVQDNNQGTATLTLEVPANATNTNLPSSPRAMFPPGVVDVYPIGSKSYP